MDSITDLLDVILKKRTSSRVSSGLLDKDNLDAVCYLRQKLFRLERTVLVKLYFIVIDAVLLQ